MIAYNETLRTFKKHIESNIIVKEVLKGLKQRLGESEKRAIRNSTGEMYKVLNESAVPDDTRIGIEYKIPITTRRIDFIIAGSSGESNNVVVVELKQWEKVKQSDGLPNVVMLGNREYTHPSWQAYSYAATLKHFNEAIEKNKIEIIPSAFLHNYKLEYLDQLINPLYNDAVRRAPVFIETDYTKLRAFVEKYIKYPAKVDLLFEIEHGKIKPTKMLVEALASMLQNNEEFILLDEQKVIAEFLYYIATKYQKSNQKHIVIVEGGAGTGKSLIAIDLLGKLIIKKAFKAFYVAKSSYVKEVYIRKLTRNIPEYQFLRNLFKGSGDFMDSSSNECHCLIVDEAHRLTRKTKRSWFYRGENQIKEIINATKITVFFIDPKQSIDIKDYGTIEEIKKWGKYYNAVIHHSDNLKLKSQFRCNGSDEYLAWVDSVLYNEDYVPSGKDVDYDIRIFDNIMNLKEEIIKKNINNKARMVAGDVFPWRSRKEKDFVDIKINGFEAKWNTKKHFATDPNAINEVGCIHTVQGMEFEYVGLIIGDDLLFRNGKVVTDYTRHPSGATEFKREKRRVILPEDELVIDRLIRNTYRVLFTRGQKGIFIYCMDNNLREYLKMRLKKL